MHMSHFSTDLQHFLTRFHKPTMDPTRIPNHNDPVDCEDRLSVANERSQSLISEGHVAPISPYHKEAMFEKPLTPSDVGKLNRLVIPKQYAEKYFPLSGCGGGDAAGTLLGFEDEAGKCWRFRYSYWNSSQSYVLTKGWSRYVKEKCLDAGDVVVFERHRSEPDRFFIAWRRRGALQQPMALCYTAQGFCVAQDSSRGGPTYQAQAERRRLAGGAKQEEEKTGNHNSTRLVRLFGVNLECQQLSHEQSSSGTTSSQTSSHQQQPIFQIQRQQEPHGAYYRNYYNYMGHPPPI